MWYAYWRYIEMKLTSLLNRYTVPRIDRIDILSPELPPTWATGRWVRCCSPIVPWRREPVEVGMLAAGDIAQKYAAGAEPVWGRRSVFRVAGKPLLVAEYFLSELAEPR